MTGFAFYSCEDVVDNPAKDPAQSWNYSVSVKFSEFDFTGAPGTPTYQAPKTLYVFNEDMTPMGTITTDATPSFTNDVTYAGTLQGAIGNNLIIATKTGADLAKQDGTIESAIENGIVQMDTVPIKIYNANSGTLTTASAKLQNKTAIVQFWLGGLAIPKDKKVTFSTDSLDIPGVTEKSFTVTLKEDLDATANWCYFTLGTNAKDPINIKAEIDADNRGLFLASERKNITLNYGKIDNLGNFNMQASQVDLTKYWAAEKEANPDTKYATFSNSGNPNKLIISQSGSEAVPVRLRLYEDATLKNINICLDEDAALNQAIYSYNYKQDGIFITLEGNNTIKNEYGRGIYLEEGTFTLTGNGSLNIDTKDEGVVISNGYNPWTNLGYPRYSAFKVDKDINVSVKSSANNYGIYIPANDTLAVNNNAKLNVECVADGSIAIKTEAAKVEIGEGATIIAKAGKNGEGINSGAEWDIKDGATIKGIGGKDGKGIDFWADVKIGKNVTIEAQGAPNISDDALGIGMNISNNTVTMDEGSTIIATGADRGGLLLYATTIDMKVGATIKAIDALNDALIINGGTVTITGKGAIEAKEAKLNGIDIKSGTLLLNGGTIEAKGGTGQAGIQNNGTLTIGTDVISVKATAGTGAKCIADGNDNEAKLEDLVADKTKFNDAIADGTRTITPKPAAE